MPRNPGAPSVFISSTPDLKEYRKAAERAGFRQVILEDFPATGHPRLDVCRAKVTEADVLVAIVANCYGDYASGTNPRTSSKAINGSNAKRPPAKARRCSVSNGRATSARPTASPPPSKVHAK